MVDVEHAGVHGDEVVDGLLLGDCCGLRKQLERNGGRTLGLFDCCGIEDLHVFHK